MENDKTINQAFQKLLETHYKQARFQKSGRAKEFERIYYANIKGRFGHHFLPDIKRQYVKMWLIDMIDTPFIANRALGDLSRIFKFAIDMEWCLTNPCAGIKTFPERKRKRFASPEEIKKIGQLIRHHLEGRRRHGALVLLALIYTGARPRSILFAKYSQLKLDPKGHGVLTFHGKGTADSGEMETVIFPPQLLSEIARQPKRNDGFIFDSRAWRGCWNAIKKEVGCTDLWARDLRRTFASIGVSSGVSIDAIGGTLNHKCAQTTKGYAMMFDSSKVATTNKIAETLDSLIG